MKSIVCAGVVAAALLVPLGLPARAQDGQPPDRFGGPRDLMVLAGRGAEIGVHVTDAKEAGVEVQEVRSDSPAEKAGLQRADRIVEFDGERVRGTRQFSRLVQETPPGRTIKATIVRSGQRKEIEITPREGRGPITNGVFPDGFVGRMPDIEMFRNRMPFNFDFDLPGLSGRRLGVDVDPLSDQLAQYFGVKEGVLVRSVTDGTPAARAGLKAGDVITSVDGQPTRSREDLVRAVRDAKDEELTIGIVREKKESTVKARLEPPRRTLRGARPV